MKFGVLKSIGHNIADSLASGIGIPINCPDTYIFDEAAGLENGSITVDFLIGRPIESGLSSTLQTAIGQYNKFLPDLCESHGTNLQSFKVLIAKFGSDAVYGPHFTVTVEDQNGRKSVDQYLGNDGRRLRHFKP